ncbi:hypothetical protein M1555_03745 [Patescibacteria group bacterium]|nr:hypothetical protein [Patescibacteria group bacterium]
MKNIQSFALLVLVVIVVLETASIFRGKIAGRLPPEETAERHGASSALPPAGPNSRGGRQMILTKGMEFKTSPLLRYAYAIAPGTMTAAAAAAMTGFTMTTATGSDGSETVMLTPKDSENEKQDYTITPGQTLYYIEQTRGDDQPDTDKDLNYRDDYCVIVGADGTVQ